MPKLTVDGVEVEVPVGSTVLQACEAAGREIPIFCYHPRLNIAGSCRMCLVEMEKSPKPIASCAMPAADGMVIKTDTPVVHKARRGVLEFLLINHPLDCPICDQGGECDLQDITLFYGPDHSRFAENKRPVPDKNLGPLVSTHMTRCIHCTRCIRFLNEVAGVEELGAVQRGEHMEITNWVEASLTSELQGNIIDLCPVGALNSKPYEYKARTWELKKTESVDVSDAVGCNIRIDARGNEVMRIVPRLHEEINEEWLSDKGRFLYDGLKKRRLDRPMVRQEGRLQPTDWRTALDVVAGKLGSLAPEKIGFVIGDLVDAETMVMVRELAAALGTPNVDCRQDGSRLGYGPRGSWLFNSTIAGIEQADAILLIGTNPRHEAPVLNARIRKRWRQVELPIARIGCAGVDLTYPVLDLGAGAQTLSDLLAGNVGFAEELRSAKNPMIIIGNAVTTRPDGGAILDLARRVAEEFGAILEDWNGFNVLHTAASRVAGLDLGLIPGEGGLDVAGMLNGGVEALFLVGADELDLGGIGNAFVVYQGHHGDRSAPRADVILPGAAWTEKHGTYVNTEGRPQRAKLATMPPGDAREDWKILRALSDALGRTVPLDSLSAVRARMVELAPVLEMPDVIVPAAWQSFGETGEFDRSPFISPIQDFYKTNAIARASAVMSECSGLRLAEHSMKATGTHG
jgi:NADH-quinone oxidoreductase subunit G